MTTLTHTAARVLMLVTAAAVAFIATAASAQELTPRPNDGPSTTQAPTRTLPADPAKRQLILLLSHYELSPTAEQLSAIELDDLHGALLELALNTEMTRITRGRAINVLVDHPIEPTRAAIDAYLASNDVEDLYILGHWVRLVGLVGDQAPSWALSILETHVSHADPTIREWTVRSLLTLRDVPETRGQVDELLLQLAIAERDPSVRAALNTGLDAGEPLKPADRPEVPRRARITQ